MCAMIMPREYVPSTLGQCRSRPGTSRFGIAVLWGFAFEFFGETPWLKPLPSCRIY